MRRLKTRQRLGKYRIEGTVGEGSYATVYRAYDTVEGIRVALKVPHPGYLDEGGLADFRREVRLVASLDHPNILPIKNADMIGGVFAIVCPLGAETVGDRIQRRYSLDTALRYAEQLLDAVAYAHDRGIIHCDLKPDNLILFDGGRLRLADFGIAKVAHRRATLTGGGTGTVGYLAPEQAFGRPSPRSDVFSAGLILYRLLAGRLPEWPYAWPGPGFDVLRRRVTPTMIAVIRRAMEMDDRKRFADARRMLTAFRKARPHALRPAKKRRPKTTAQRTWQTARVSHFTRRFGKALEAHHHCARCLHPVSEAMAWCPWCGTPRPKHREATRFPARCSRCGRGIKRDWPFCAWCYGGRVQEPSERRYSDARYEGRCANRACTRKDLLPFSRYCPWCRTKVRRPWKLEGGEKCPRCRWGVAAEYWHACPWCGLHLTGLRRFPGPGGT